MRKKPYGIPFNRTNRLLKESEAWLKSQAPSLAKESTEDSHLPTPHTHTHATDMPMIYESNNITLHRGDCLEVLRTLPDASIDAVVTDPPAGISFMGRAWDHHKGGRDAWVSWMKDVSAECLRVLKPGAHALVWALPRTSHWTATAWENAGFEVRDCVNHVFGSGFPKSLDISKAIDKHLGEERPVFLRVPRRKKTGESKCAQADRASEFKYSHPASDAAKQWDGWGSALKPAHEMWWLLRKPLAESTLARNVIANGVGGINIDACRVGISGGHKAAADAVGYDAGTVNALGGNLNSMRSPQRDDLGRYPANLIHDGSDGVVALFPETSGGRQVFGARSGKETGRYGAYDGQDCAVMGHSDQAGSAARYFMACPDNDAEDEQARSMIYCPKASKTDRDEGCEELPQQRVAKLQGGDNDREDLDPVSARFRTQPSGNHHPTIKATSLMRYLCRMVTPKGGTVLDPFTGSGSTGKGAVLEGFSFVGIEQDADYFEIAKARINFAMRQKEEGKEQSDDRKDKRARTGS
jgi:site-specific DNA-methyltransferase (adenine-specific)